MITLLPMSEPDFQIYLVKAIREYASEKVQAGNWTIDEAPERSRQEFKGYLPEGVQTPDHFLFSLINEKNEKVGFLWYAALPNQPGQAFIYDFEIYEAFRRQGYASQAIAALEKDAGSRRMTQIGLHVFGHNIAARELYKKMGFTETNVMMSKKI
jgi:ribosomal protein S18 acetylase RimI-like enzyme